MALDFTPDSPPKSGNARKIWDWWIRISEETPQSLGVIRSRKWQKEIRGRASYIINNKYFVYSVPDALKQTMNDADPDPATGDYHFS